MKQLGIIDAAFVNLEHPTTPQHVGGLGIYDPSTAPEELTLTEVIKHLQQRLNRLPSCRSRLVRTPGNLDRPYWIEEVSFDPDLHIHHVALPKPGNWYQLCKLISRLHAIPLDMTLPLWETYVIEGLDDILNVSAGSFALYTKVHHAMADGAAGAAIIAAIHDLEAAPAPQPEHLVIEPDPAPDRAELAKSAAVNQVVSTLKMARGAVGLARDLGKFALGIARKEIPPPAINSPQTRFNDPVTAHRSFDAAEFSLDEIKQIKSVVGAKVNDVVLAIVSGALRRYLDSVGELPETSLAVSVPVDMRTRRGVTGDNNQIGSVFQLIHSNIKDPVERLRAIAKSSIEAKQHGEASPLVDMLKVTGAFSPALARPLVGLYVHNQLTRHVPLKVTGVVSNVAGPPCPLYMGGARMTRYFCLGLLTPGVGLFNLAFSADGMLTISVLADRQAIPNARIYRDYLYQSFEELREAARKLEDEEYQEEMARAETPRSNVFIREGAEKPRVKKQAQLVSDKKLIKTPAKAPVKKAKPVSQTSFDSKQRVSGSDLH